MVVGICGKACSGKDKVASLFEEQGYLLVNADKLGVDALTDCQGELVAQFGTSILTDNKVDRKKLGSLVFGNQQKLRSLNEISHPYIIEKIETMIAQNQGKKIAINAALLPYWPVGEVTHLVWVQSHPLLRLLRSLKRDGRGLKFSLQRMKAQWSLSPKLFFKPVDTYTIANNGSYHQLKTHTLQVIEWIEKTT